jgi:HlyD family secretion protein
VNDVNDAPTEMPTKRPRNHLWRTVRTWLRRIVLAAIAIGLVALVALAMRPQPIAVDVAAVERGLLRVTIDEDGRTRVKDRYVVSAPLGGNVARIELHPGDAVHAGDVIARIVPLAPPLLDARTRAEAEAHVAAAMAQQRQARASVDRARAASEFAQHEAERTAALAARGSATGQEIDRAQMEARTQQEELTSLEFGVRVADYEVQVARATLGRLSGASSADEQMEVTAPVDGRVLRVIQESAGPVTAGADLLEVGDPAALEIVVDVLTSDAVRIPAGAHVGIDRWGGDPLSGRVRLVEPAAFTRVSSLGVEEQRVNVIVDLDDPHDRWSTLGDGYRVEAHVVVVEVENALLVPASAVFRHDEGWAVYRMQADHAHLAPIEVGERNGVSVEVRSGLDDHDTVIVHPSEHVTDGSFIARRT